MEALSVPILAHAQELLPFFVVVVVVVVGMNSYFVSNSELEFLR